MSSRRLVRAGAFFLTFAGLERSITLARGGKTEAWNFLSAGAVTSAVFGFVSGQLRRGMLIGGVLSLVGTPLYLLVVSGGIDSAADAIARAIVGTPAPHGPQDPPAADSATVSPDSRPTQLTSHDSATKEGRDDGEGEQEAADRA